jgi:hypothetical protein
MDRERVGHSTPQAETKIKAIKRALPWRRKAAQLADRYSFIAELFDSQRGLVVPLWDKDAAVDVEAVGYRREGKIDPLIVSRPSAHQTRPGEAPLKIQEVNHFFRGHGYPTVDAYYLHPNGTLTKEVTVRPGTPLRETAAAELPRTEEKALLKRLSGAEMYKLKTQ